VRQSTKTPRLFAYSISKIIICPPTTRQLRNNNNKINIDSVIISAIIRSSLSQAEDYFPHHREQRLGKQQKQISVIIIVPTQICGRLGTLDCFFPLAPPETTFGERVRRDVLGQTTHAPTRTLPSTHNLQHASNHNSNNQHAAVKSAH
jgi:hypothetical protein